MHLNDGRTVWALFLLSMYETKSRNEDTPDLTRAWYEAGEQLVQHGASLDCWLEDSFSTGLTATMVLGKVFEPGKVQNLMAQVKHVQAERTKEAWSYKIWTGFGLLSSH